jgi:hypothetical protein
LINKLIIITVVDVYLLEFILIGMLVDLKFAVLSSLLGG